MFNFASSSLRFSILCIVTLILGVFALQIVAKIPLEKSSKKKSQSKKVHRDIVLIYGPSDSGKTMLFYRLQNSAYEFQTVMSSRINSMRVKDMSEKAPLRENTKLPGNIRLVDFPGHSRFEYQLKDYLNSALFVLYLIDHLNKSTYNRVAENLFNFLSDESIIENNTHIIVCCNKSDIRTPDLDIIIQKLQYDIERIKVARNLSLDSAKTIQHVGVYGKHFEFKYSEVSVHFIKISILRNDLTELFHTINKIIL